MATTFKTRAEAEGWRGGLPVPQPGETAPDFELRDPNGVNPIRLSQFKEQKPVALIFGSFT